MTIDALEKTLRGWMNAHTPTRADTALRLARKIVATAERDKAAAVIACDSALDILAPSLPDLAPFWTADREATAWWADCATETSAAEMLAALLKRFGRGKTHGRNSKKRAIVALWNSLDSDDRAAFRAFIDERGE